MNRILLSSKESQWILDVLKNNISTSGLLFGIEIFHVKGGN